MRGTVFHHRGHAAQFRAVSESGIKPAPCGDHSITIIHRRTAASWQAIEKRRQQQPDRGTLGGQPRSTSQSTGIGGRF
jgi:hypothetical protein